ncbi:sensor histidine kinase [Naasia aerilata]|uniref:sensor histidine kinase n=1 Tax=Naasia aerilata TaxID=1162966 RepID=UPI002572A595|nr:ATP-binding protein [Naasia aerilata]
MSAGIARASHVIAAACLLGATAATVMQQAVAPARVIWPALLPLVLIGLLLLAVDRHRSRLWVGAYLVLGAALAYLYAAICLVQVPVLTTSGAWVFTMLKVALVMSGAVGVRPVGAILPPIAGYVLGEASMGLAAVETGKPVGLDITAALAAVLVVVVAVATTLSRPAARNAQPALHRAARDERIAELRSQVEARAAALLHDTVLSDLAAIASAPTGRIAPGLAERLTGDLEVIIGQDWSDTPSQGPSPDTGEWAASGLAQAVEDGRALGLDVTVSGDPSSLAALSRSVDDMLGLAVRQLLVNVHKHSGEREAEVVVYAGAGMVSVMVIDAGRGFDEAATARDRFGLRTSVRSRIESVGGRVQVWSAPGRGTSVLLQVPDESAVEVAPAPTGNDSVPSGDQR